VAGSRLSSNSESRRQKNHEPPKSGIPKCKKTDIHPRLSCKFQYFLSLNYSYASIASEFFTDDELRSGLNMPFELKQRKSSCTNPNRLGGLAGFAKAVRTYQTALDKEKRMGGVPVESARSRNWQFA
jgi:hypothetical protein